MFKIIVLLNLLIFTSLALAEPVIIVNASNANAIDAKVVKRIFLGKEKKFADGSETVPVNQDASSATRQAFDTDVLKRSTTQVAAYWSKLVFTGKGIPPKELASDAEVIDLVSANPNVIGYVDRASVTGAVKVIEL